MTLMERLPYTSPTIFYDTNLPFSINIIADRVTHFDHFRV